ncbi:MAG TPA: F0F1 ATP synthase subunit A [Gemmatimonadaceae bacterium]|jgi:F-type H+-transporting ATPase subunit a|nr:F0F1 ATP synthase subunit A [Gemmatimonadaceae bacterium]
MKTGSLLFALLIAAAPLAAQEASLAQPQSSVPQAIDSSAARAAEQTAAEVQHGSATPMEHGPSAVHGEAAEHSICGHHGDDIITPHITDSKCIEVPSFPKIWVPREVPLPQWAPIHIGSVAIDISPTKHVVMLLVAAALCCIILIGAARAHVRHTTASGRPKGFATGIEAMVLYIRQEVAIPNLGHHGEKYVPFILSLFFFILFANLLGLIPYGSTATGNVSVTATLAIITFVVIELAGMRAQGLGYLNTLFYWNKDLPGWLRFPMFLLMSPIEMVGKITKPFALTIRLFANMTAGHIVVLALIGLIFFFKSYVFGVAPLAMAVAIMMLELFVAFLQAFIFSLLASVFIGQIREGAH